MGLLGDIQKALESFPIWKKLVKVPEQIEGLERRIAELEEKLSQPLSKDACPSCGERTWFVVSSTPNEIAGEMGAMDNTYKCRSCGFSTTKMET